MFINDLFEICSEFGMKMPRGGAICFHSELNLTTSRVEMGFQYILDQLKSNYCQLVIVFLPEKRSNLYCKYICYVFPVKFYIVTLVEWDLIYM